MGGREMRPTTILAILTVAAVLVVFDLAIREEYGDPARDLVERVATATKP